MVDSFTRLLIVRKVQCEPGDLLLVQQPPDEHRHGRTVAMDELFFVTRARTKGNYLFKSFLISGMMFCRRQLGNLTMRLKELSAGVTDQTNKSIVSLDNQTCGIRNAESNQAGLQDAVTNFFEIRGRRNDGLRGFRLNSHDGGL